MTAILWLSLTFTDIILALVASCVNIMRASVSTSRSFSFRHFVSSVLRRASMFGRHPVAPGLPARRTFPGSQEARTRARARKDRCARNTGARARRERRRNLLPRLAALYGAVEQVEGAAVRAQRLKESAVLRRRPRPLGPPAAAAAAAVRTASWSARSIGGSLADRRKRGGGSGARRRGGEGRLGAWGGARGARCRLHLLLCSSMGVDAAVSAFIRCLAFVMVCMARRLGSGRIAPC